MLCRCAPSPTFLFAAAVLSCCVQFTTQRFYDKVVSKICCGGAAEKLVELKHEECYEKELSDAALAAASGAAPAEEARDARLTQLNELQLSEMMGERPHVFLLAHDHTLTRLLSGQFLDIESKAAADLSRRVLDGVEEANGMDSGTMARMLELQDVFMLKTSLLSRLRMQREDVAHTQLMSKCQAILTRTKELGGLMEQVC